MMTAHFARCSASRLATWATKSVKRDGREALDSFELMPSDLVLTDIVMPEKEGRQMIAEFRRAHPSVKVIAMSGGGRAMPIDYLNVATALGADRVLVKPFSDESLRSMLTELLP